MDIRSSHTRGGFIFRWLAAPALFASISLAALGGDAAPQADTSDQAGGDAAAVMPGVDFNSSLKEHRRGAEGAIALRVSGEMPEGGDVLVLAWSIDQYRMVPAFAHTLRGEPWVISPAMLDKLPAGKIELQLLPRLDGRILSKTTRELRVGRSSASRPDVGASDKPGKPDKASAEQPADHPASDPSTNRPEHPASPPVLGGDSGDAKSAADESSRPSKEPEVSFAFSAGTPEVYRHGSGQDIYLDVDGELPEGADILMLSWTNAQEQMVEEFAHKLRAKPFRVDSAMLDRLPVGSGDIQALLRMKGRPVAIKKFPITIVAAKRGANDLAIATLPMTAAGFTRHTKSPDTRVVYVSVHGDDDNDGLSPATAVQSAARGYELLRDGYPDWLLFKAGQTFEGGIGWFGKSGRSATQRMVIGAYGKGERPLFRTHGRGFIGNFGDDPVEHVSILGLHAVAADRDPSEPEFIPDARSRPSSVRNETGIRWLAVGGDVLVEDCVLEYYKMAIVITGLDGIIQDFTVRRTIIRNSYGHHNGGLGGHSSGIYASRVAGLTVEQSLLDHNGWNEHVEGAGRTVFNHNIYIQRDCRDVTIRQNIITRGASHGLQLRPGGVVDDNFFGANALAFFVADSESYVTNNVVMRSDNISDSAVRGYGIEIQPAPYVKVENNIISQKRGSAEWAPALSVTFSESGWERAGGVYNVELSGNKVYQWACRYDGGRESISIQTDRVNIISQSGNQMDEASGGASTPAWIDPDRCLGQYSRSLGMAASLEAFIEARAQRPRGQWSPRLCASAVNNYIRAGFDVLPYD